jgi:mannose-6-phosphate isomerase-like protein (cupin superfamily)
MNMPITSEELNKIVNSSEGMRESIDRLSASQDPTVFTLRTPLLDEGRTNMPLAATENMWIQLKCYASGGENAIHAHAHEDHIFVILQGEAVFYRRDGQTTRLGPNQGIMLPANAYYKFHADGADNLVLLRIGSRTRTEGDILARIDEKGRDFDGFSTENASPGKRRTPVLSTPPRWFE